MKLRSVPIFLLSLMLISFAGCAKKADPKRSIEKIQKEVASMPLAVLETQAADYAAAIRAQKAEIEAIQQKIQRMPLDKAFSNNSMTRRIAEIGRTAEALFERYRIYAQAFQEKGGDVTKIQIEPALS
jgi:ribosome-binding ATPase YchF (GTP1/OBG family)